MGEMLMAKCTTLVEENEEIGNQASEGKVKKRVVDPKTSQSTRKIKHPNSLLGVVHVLVSKSKVNVIDVVGRFPDDDTNDIDDYRQGMI
ncbi:hypothetical protein JHK85_010522 [Glycine max]|nr:hypothetical protein JHK87_010111 [Glycine soja]KAG5049419.1 hypothetical protein JHK85_010522 [Glycine max]KAG5066512.1 hypothetical protein JHK86_010243 [Glycine max]